jgi:glycosyltransferase A (GT-A) superfamily protein (DUF2064 family)
MRAGLISGSGSYTWPGLEHPRPRTVTTAYGDVDVLGSALDGGYYLTGLRRSTTAAFAIDARLWGGPHVLAAAKAQLARVGCAVCGLSALRDLDTPEDAAALLDDPALPSAVATCLRPRELCA